MVNAVALICVRGGSKGLPKKNIRLLAGKPLIAWAIDHAKAVPRIKRVIVSTDSQEIADIAISYGGEVPFMRPPELARDESPEWLVWRHALEFLHESDGCYPDVMVSVPATAPLRLPLDIENCLDEYEQNNVDMVIAVTDAHRSPYFNMVSINEDKSLKLVIPPQKNITRRQDAPIVYDLTTVVYAMKPEYVITHNSIFEGNVRSIHVPPERALDIDTPLDFKIAECLLGIDK